MRDGRQVSRLLSGSSGCNRTCVLPRGGHGVFMYLHSEWLTEPPKLRTTRSLARWSRSVVLVRPRLLVQDVPQHISQAPRAFQTVCTSRSTYFWNWRQEDHMTMPMPEHAQKTPGMRASPLGRRQAVMRMRVCIKRRGWSMQRAAAPSFALAQTQTLQPAWQHTAANEACDARSDAGLVPNREIPSAPEQSTSSASWRAWQHTYMSIRKGIITSHCPPCRGGHRGPK